MRCRTKNRKTQTPVILILYVTDASRNGQLSGWVGMVVNKHMYANNANEGNVEVAEVENF